VTTDQSITAAAPSSPPEPSPVARRRRGVAARDYATVALLLVLCVVFALTNSSFLTESNIKSILIVQTVTMCITLGIMFPLVVGEFDLSAGYLLGLVCMVGAYLAEHHHGAGTVIVAMLAVGIVAGVVNGLFTEKVRISSFIATLGTGIVLQGLTQGLSGGSVLDLGIPPAVVTLGRGEAGGVTWSVWITLGFAVVLFYVLEHTPAGRTLYAIGGSERVAYLAGIRTHRLKVIAFAVSGLLVACGAVFALGQNGSASPSFGPDLLLPAYAAAFLGVTTYRGGYYNVVGSVVGILLLAVGFDGLSLWGVPFWVQPVFNGAVLLIAVMLAKAETRQVRVGS